MKLTEKQLLFLITTLQDSLKINDPHDSVFTFDEESRWVFFESIINQQEDEVIIGEIK